jgi:hypothetical protein
MSQRLAYPRTNSPWAVLLKPHLGWPGPTEREPRSHCFDVTHQVRGRAAKRARHRRGHIFSPRRMEASGEVGQLVEALRESQPGRAAVREQKAGTVPSPLSRTSISSSFGR